MLEGTETAARLSWEQESKKLFTRKSSCCFIDLQRKVHRFLPNKQVAISPNCVRRDLNPLVALLHTLILNDDLTPDP